MSIITFTYITIHFVQVSSNVKKCKIANFKNKLMKTTFANLYGHYDELEIVHKNFCKCNSFSEILNFTSI